MNRQELNALKGKKNRESELREQLGARDEELRLRTAELQRAKERFEIAPFFK